MKWSGQRQKAQRKAMGYTLDGLGYLANCTAQNIGAIEQKGTQPKVGTAVLIAKYLKKPVSYFMDK